ncbi:MAG: hypothetical protein WAK39_14545 [Pseudolabrys sp.]|jgi:hypothetical protein
MCKVIHSLAKVPWQAQPMFISASNDPVTHNTLSAEQKLYGPLQVTTAVTDFGQTSSSKSISGFQAALVDLSRAAEYPKSRA